MKPIPYNQDIGDTERLFCPGLLSFNLRSQGRNVQFVLMSVVCVEGVRIREVFHGGNNSIQCKPRQRHSWLYPALGYHFLLKITF